MHRRSIWHVEVNMLENGFINSQVMAVITISSHCIRLHATWIFIGKYCKFSYIHMTGIQYIKYNGLSIFLIDMYIICIVDPVHYVTAVYIDGRVIREPGCINLNLSSNKIFRSRYDCSLLSHRGRRSAYGVNHVVDICLYFFTRHMRGNNSVSFRLS